MEPPKKRWKVSDDNKDLLARELAFNTVINKLNTREASMKNILTDATFDADKTIDELKTIYKDLLETDKIYDVNKILNTVFYGFKTTEQNLVEDPGNATQENIQADDRLFFMLHFRQYNRILRRLAYMSYIQQGMIEECTRFDIEKYKILHKYYGNRLETETADRIARSMNLDDYIKYYKDHPFKIQEVEEEEEEERDTGIELVTISPEIPPAAESI